MLPKQLKYGSRVEITASKLSRVNIDPNNGTSVTNIPTRTNLVLVPNKGYLKFNLKML